MDKLGGWVYGEGCGGLMGEASWKEASPGRALHGLGCGASPRVGGGRWEGRPGPEVEPRGPGTPPPAAAGPTGNHKGKLCWAQHCFLK